MKALKIRKLFSVIGLLGMVMIFGTSANLQALEWKAPKPLVNVHAFYDTNQNLLFSDMKFLNVPQDLPSVDVYMVLRSVADDQTYYVTIDMLKLVSSGNFYNASTITDKPTPYFTGLNFSEMGLDRIELPGFPIHVGDLPLSEGHYLIMLALVETGADPATADSIGNVAVSVVELPEFRHDPDPSGDCDFNGDGFVDDHEKQECDKNEPMPFEPVEPCDFNGDGFVGEHEKQECDKNEPMPFEPCDFNGDGFVDEHEKQECDNNEPMPFEPVEPCDFNGDGFVDEHEKQECDNNEPMPFEPVEPCDFNGNGIVDDNEKQECDKNAPLPLDPCDLNEDGIVDEQEKEQCGEDTEPAPSNPFADLFNR